MTLASDSPEISRNQAKAARALLAWTQLDLARSSGLSVSTIADFERGSRTPHLANASSLRIALEKGGVVFRDGGVMIDPRLVPTQAPQLPGVPLKWVTSLDIRQWSERNEAKAELPLLIYHLILANRNTVDADFPFDESINQPGWDGHCHSTLADDEFIPTGVSRWELTTTGKANLRKKLHDDFNKRTRTPLDAIPSETTYVAVATYRFADKRDWIEEKKALGVWKDVRVLDADDLETWLSRTPSVALQLAVQVRKRPASMRLLDEVWTEWSRSSIFAMSEDIMVVDRDSEATAIMRWLKGEPDVISVKADSLAESAAFLYAAIAQLPVQYRDAAKSRCVVVDSEEEARKLTGIRASLNILMNDVDPGIASRLVADGHKVYNAVGPDTADDNTVVKLGRPSVHSLEEELVTMGLKEAQAFHYARNCGQSLTTLRRQLQSYRPRVPSWAADPSKILLGAVLAGAWNEKSEIDRAELEYLCDAPYSEIQAYLLNVAASMDSPIRYASPIWNVAAMQDAWALLSRYITSDHAEKLSIAFQRVLSIIDPELDIDPADRWTSVLLDRPPQASKQLRAGLIEAVACLGIVGDRLPHVPHAFARANNIVTTLLRDASDHLWGSLRRELRYLAEASPASFLGGLQSAIARMDYPLRHLFEKSGFFGTDSHLQDLLVALKILAWDKWHVGLVSIILADLVEMEPKDRENNRSRAALRQILIPWCPQTYASGQQRMDVVRAVLDHSEQVGWDLLIDLAPKSNDASSFSPKPVWQTFRPDDYQAPTNVDVALARSDILKLILETIGTSGARWKSIVPTLYALDESERTLFIDKLEERIESFDLSCVDVSDFRNKLRSFIARFQAHRMGNRGISEQSLTKLTSLLDRLEPDEPSLRFGWLFNRAISDDPSGSYAEAEMRRKAQQLNAIDVIFSQLGIPGVLQFAKTVSVQYAVGYAAAGSVRHAELRNELQEVALENEETEGLAVGMLTRRSENEPDYLKQLFQDRIASNASANTLLRIALTMPCTHSVWDVIQSAGKELDERYWSRINVYSINGVADSVFAAKKFVEADRARDALCCIAQHSENDLIDDSIFVDILRAASAAEPRTDKRFHNDETMFSYYAGRVFSRLDTSSIPEDEIASLEWVYFRVLENSDRPSKTLHKRLARDPLFFGELVTAVYRPSRKDDETDDGADAGGKENLRVANQAYRVLHDWSVVPGTREDGTLDGDALRKWVKDARTRCKDADRAAVGDIEIGNILSATPRLGSETWPPVAICAAIESARSKDLEDGFDIGVRNRRGVTTRGVGDGGEQERALAGVYDLDAINTAFRFPRVSAVLRQIADAYRTDAKYHDDLSKSVLN